MITAWSPTHLVRARASAGPLLRVLAMAVLLFGVLLAHGPYGPHVPHVESVRGHLVTSAPVPAYVSSDGGHGVLHLTATQVLAQRAEMGEPQGGHGPAHQGEHCVSGQPQQGPVLTPPCFAASVSESAAVGYASVRRGEGEPVISSASSAALRLSVVRQV